jgi:hypothetical protein
MTGGIIEERKTARREGSKVYWRRSKEEGWKIRVESTSVQDCG